MGPLTPSTLAAVQSPDPVAHAAGTVALQAELALSGEDAQFEAVVEREMAAQGEYTAERYRKQYPNRVKHIINLLRAGTATRQIKAIFAGMGWGIHHNTIKAIKDTTFSEKELADILLTKQRRIADSSADEINDLLEEIRALPLADRLKYLDKMGIVHGIAADKVQGLGTLTIEIKDTTPAALGAQLLEETRALQAQVQELSRPLNAINVTPETP